MATIRLKLLLFLYIIHTIFNISDAIEDHSFPDNIVYSGKPCEQSVYLNNDAKEFLTVRGDYTKNDAELAFDCKIEVILPPGLGILSSNGVTVECKKTEVKTLGDAGGCPVSIEVNRGSKKVCLNTEELKGKFAPKNGKIELRIMSRAKARNQFKGGVPTFECKLKLDDGNNAISYSSDTAIDVEKATGFFTTQTCNEEFILDKENDVKTIEAPVQQYEGLSYFDCTKVIKVAENFNLVVRCSKFRFVDYDYNQKCIAFAQIDNGEKVCYPERISGTFKPNGGKVTLKLHSNALNGLRYKVGKPLFDCRLTIETSTTVQGFIWMYSSTGSTSSLYRSLRVEDLPKENRKHHEIPKMTKEDYEKAVVRRATPVEGISACGGHINLEKWGYTFTLQGETVSNPSTIVNYDCDWTFYLPSKVHSIAKFDALVIKCDKMPISKPSKQPCSAFYTVNNELSYCNDDQHSHVDGFFKFVDSNVVFRARSAHNNIFDNKKPIFNCTVSAISLIDNHLTRPPKSQKSITGGDKSNKIETKIVSLDGRRPTFIFGESRPNDGPVDIDDHIFFKVQSSTNPHLQTFLVLQCNRLNTIKVKDKKCQVYYLVNEKHKVCDGEEINGLFQPFDNFGGNCLVKLSIKTEGEVSFIGDNTPYYQCKAFIHDMTPWSEIVSGTRLLSANSIGSYIAGNRKPHDKPCGIDPTIEVLPAGSVPEPIESDSPSKSDEPTSAQQTTATDTVSTAPGVTTVADAVTVVTEKEANLKSEEGTTEIDYAATAPPDRRKRDIHQKETPPEKTQESKAVVTEKTGGADPNPSDTSTTTIILENLFNKHSSILGSYPDIDSVPILKLAKLRISELADPRYNLLSIGHLKIGQLGAIAELAKLGRLGGIKLGQLRKLHVFSQLSFKKFGSIGEIQINQLSKDGKLGLFGRLTLDQLSRLASENFMKRLTIGLVADVLPMNRNLLNEISEVLHNAEFNGHRHGQGIKLEKAHYAFQLPQINRVYDLINLNNILYETLESLSEQKILTNFSSFHSPVGKGEQIGDSQKTLLTKEGLLKNAEHKLEKILELLEMKSKDLKSDSEKLDDLCVEKLYNVAQVLISITDSILNALSGGSANALLTKLHHIELWNVNRLLAGFLGGKYSIVGITIEPTLEAIVQILGGSLQDLKKDAPNVSFSNDRALYLIVRLLGKPHERMCPKNITKPEVRQKRSPPDYDYEREPEQSLKEPEPEEEDAMVKAEIPDEVSLTCQVITDNEHYKAIVEERDGGTLTLAKLYEVSNILVTKLNNLKTKSASLKELTLLDRPLQWRISRLTIGFISGILKQFDDDLGPELYKISDLVVKGLDVILPTSSQSLAMGISGTMDSTLISLGVSVSRLLSVAQGRSINDTINPLASLFKIEANTNGITAPILEAVNSLINNVANLGPFILKRLLDSLLHHIKSMLYTTQNIVPHLASSDLLTFIKVYSGALYAIAKISYSTDLKVMSLLLALNNTLPVDTLSTIAKTEIMVGAPHHNLVPSHVIVCGQVSTFSIDFAKLKASLGTIAPIVISKDTKSYSTNDNNAWIGPKLEEIPKSDLIQLCSAICVELETAVSQASNSLLTGKLNMGQVMSLVQSIFGFIIGVILSISQSFVDFADRGSNIFYSNKVLSGIDFVAQISKMLSGVTQDLGLAEKTKIGSISATANFNQESNAKIFQQIDAAFNSIGTGSGGMFAEVGLTAVSLAYGVGTTVDSIANFFYDFGHSKAKTSKNQLIRGTIGAIQSQLGSAPANDIFSTLGTLEETESLRERIAAKRRTLILNHDKIQTPINKHGIVVVATDNSASNIGSFYDEEDLGQETKDLIMNEVSHVLLQKDIQNQLLSANKGKKIHPTTIEVEIPIDGTVRKINVTISSLTNDHSVSDHSFGKYLGPPADDHEIGHDLGGEYAPQGMQTCIEWRESAAVKLRSYPQVFLPTCLSDGSFSPLQCDDSAGLCWCVNERGQQVAGTVSKLTKPDCNNLDKHKSDSDKTNADTIDNEIDIGSKYLIGSSLEQKEKSAQMQYKSNDYKTSNCLKEQRQRELLTQRRVASALGVFIPNCLEDGSYSPIQCDKRTNFCWCVTKNGKEIPNSAKIGEKPTNCGELQETYSANKNRLTTSSWTYLWEIVKKWQELSHSRVQSERRSDPLYKYKPNGVLVRLPKSSGFDNSVMFCAKEPAGPGLPSPYEVWQNIMVAENPVFNKTQYELSPKELNRLALIRLPLHNGETIQVPLVSVIEAFPAAQDLYVKFNGDTDKLEEVLQAMDVDWSLLLATKKSTAKTDSSPARPAGVLGSGHMNMVSAQKMCFCYMTPNAGSVINAGVFGKSRPKSHSRSSFSGFSFNQQSSVGLANSSDSSAAAGDEEEKVLKASNDEPENSLHAGLKGESGRIMHAVTQAITDLNPIRMIISLDLNPLLNINGFNLAKVKAPLGFFSKSFFDQLSAKTQMTKKQLGNELGVDLNAQDSDAMVSIGGMLKIGHKNNMKLGDYVALLGIDLTTPMNKYDAYMVETVRKPVELADTLLNDGFQKTMKKIQEFVNENGGPMNAALKVVGDATGKDVAGATQQTINAITNFSVKKQAEKMNDNVKDYANEISLKAKKWVETNFGNKSDISKLKTKVSQTMNSVTKFINSILNGNQFEAFVDMIGQVIGPTGRSLVYIVYAPTSTMLNQVFGPLFLIPKILLTEGPFIDRVLALPPVIIQMSGGLFKPILMVGEPMLRLFRFISTGEYTKSLSAGLDISARFGINIYGGAYRAAKNNSDSGNDKKQRRDKRDTDDSEARKLTPDQKTADAYQGGPPPGGYRLGVQNDGRTDLNEEDLITRILLSPDFILKAGGNVYIPFSSVLAPSLRSLNTVIFGKDEFVKRVQEVPDIIRSIGLIGPLADIISSLLPFLKLGQKFQKSELKATDIMMQSPALLKEMTGGTLYNVWKDPMKLLKSMLSWLEGNGGVLAMLRMQARGESPVFTTGAASEYKIESGFVTDSIGEFFGGWFLGYIQALGPIGSTISALFNGILGNVIDPVRYLDSEPNLRNQPLKNLINSFDNIPKLYNAAADKKMFLITILGGQDPDPLKEVGFDIEKLTLSGIDAAYFVVSGTQFLSPEGKKQLSDASRAQSVGITVSKLSKIDLTIKQVLDSGLLDANPEKLSEMGIDLFTIMNRIMRNSIEDKYKLMMAGINPKIMLKAGIDPSVLLSGGIGAIKENILKNIGVDKRSLNPDSLKKIGLNSVKLTSKGIDARKLAIEGIEAFSSVAKTSMGIDSEKLINSITYGLEPEKLKKGGIDVRKMIANGVDPKLLLTGGLRAAIKNDVSKESLLRIGIDLDLIVSEGINMNLLLDIGAAVLNPINLIKLGIDPQRAIIGILSQSGLDTLTGGMDDAMSATLGFVTSILQIMKQILGLVPAIRELPVIGPMIVSKDGKFTGVPGFILYKIIGIDNYGGLLQFSKKLFGGKLTMVQILELLNPIRVVNSMANSKGPPIKSKPKNKPVDDYVNSALNMKQGLSVNKVKNYGSGALDDFDTMVKSNNENFVTQDIPTLDPKIHSQSDNNDKKEENSLKSEENSPEALADEKVKDLMES